MQKYHWDYKIVKLILIHLQVNQWSSCENSYITRITRYHITYNKLSWTSAFWFFMEGSWKSSLCPTKKKTVTRLKTLGSLKSWETRSHHCLQYLRDRNVSRGNEDIQEGTPRSRATLGKSPGAGKPALYVWINGGSLRRRPTVRVSRQTRYGGIPTVPWVLWYFSQLISEKNRPMLSFFLNIPEPCVFLNKVCHLEKLVYWILTSCELLRLKLTWVREITNSSPLRPRFPMKVGEKSTWDTLWHLQPRGTGSLRDRAPVVGL